VLPFVNLSNDPEQEYFSDGITEDITTDLSKLSSLFVIDRNSAFTYKGKPVKVQDVSRDMGVQYVLEGSVRKTNDQVRITVQLIDGTTGGHLWSERYDRPLKEVFVLQDEIVQKIVTTLKLQLTLWEQGVLVRKTTDNLEAYDYYLRGLEYSFRFTKEVSAQAKQMYEKAIELDPHYAQAYASLGMSYFVDWNLQWNQTPETFARATELAQKSITLDDSLPNSHFVLGWIYLWKKQHDRAIAEAERAIALDPNFVSGYVELGDILTFAGQPEKAIELIEKAMRLSPRFPSFYLNNLGAAYLMARRYDEAIAALKKCLAHAPNYFYAHMNLATAYSELGREEEARSEAAEVLRINPQFSLEVLKQTAPVKDPAVAERVFSALRKAGLK
jgi:adenylate cyclase